MSIGYSTNSRQKPRGGNRHRAEEDNPAASRARLLVSPRWIHFGWAAPENTLGSDYLDSRTARLLAGLGLNFFKKKCTGTKIFPHVFRFLGL